MSANTYKVHTSVSYPDKQQAVIVRCPVGTFDRVYDPSDLLQVPNRTRSLRIRTFASALVVLFSYTFPTTVAVLTISVGLSLQPVKTKKNIRKCTNTTDCRLILLIGYSPLDSQVTINSSLFSDSRSRSFVITCNHYYFLAETM